MTAFHGSVRTVLSEINLFLHQTLRQEKLSRKVIQHKEKIQELISDLQSSYPQLKTEENGVISEDVHVSDIAAKDLCNVTKAGFLEKRRKKEVRLRSIYQRRYCVIEYGVFYYYIHPTDKKQAGAFSLKGYKFHKAPYLPSDLSKGIVSFELTGSRRRTYQFLAESKQDMEEWQDAVEKFNGLENKSRLRSTQSAGDTYEEVDLPGEEHEDIVDGNSSDYDQDCHSDVDDDDSYEIPKTKQCELQCQSYCEHTYIVPIDSDEPPRQTDRPTRPNRVRDVPPSVPPHETNTEEQKSRNISPSPPISSSPSVSSAKVRPAPRKIVPPKEVPPKPPKQPCPKPETVQVLPPKPVGKPATKSRTPPSIAPKVKRKPPKITAIERNDTEDIYDDVDNRLKSGSRSDESCDEENNPSSQLPSRNISEESIEIPNEPFDARAHDFSSREETPSGIYTDAFSGVP